MSISACWPPQNPFYRRIFENQKGLGTSFQATFLIDFFDKKIHFVILHKLAKFHYQIVFTSQVIKQYVFRVSWLGISWCHDVWIFRKLKFDYLKNEKSFRSAIKKSFSLVLQVVSFRHPKRTSKNLADTAFKVQKLGNSLTLFAKRVCAVFFCFSMPSFVAWILWPELRIYSQGVWFFDKVENII